MPKQKSKPRLTQKQKVIAYLIGKLGTRNEGRKKLMKLLFLVEHFDPTKERLIKKGLLGNDFIIYRYGVFSFDVMGDYTSLINRGLIGEQPIKMLEGTPIPLDESLKSRIDDIVYKFGGYSSYHLEISTLEMLKLNKQTKLKHQGEDVSDFIEE